MPVFIVNGSVTLNATARIEAETPEIAYWIAQNRRDVEIEIASLEGDFQPDQYDPELGEFASIQIADEDHAQA